MSKLRGRKKKNVLIGPKYNVSAWKHFGSTKKLKGGFSFDGRPDIEGTLIRKKGDTFKFRPKINLRQDEHNIHARKTEGTRVAQWFRKTKNKLF